jgi:alkaline phosphatase D
MDYRAWNFTQEDNFCRIDVDRANHRLVVVPYDDEGRQIRAGGFFGLGGKLLEARLDLAPW